MDTLLNLLSGSSSMEATYLKIIALIDEAETLANKGVGNEFVSAETALQLGEAKQRFIQDFADTNRERTLEGMRGKARRAAETPQT